MVEVKKACQANVVDQHMCVVYSGLRVWPFLWVLSKLISVCGLSCGHRCSDCLKIGITMNNLFCEFRAGFLFATEGCM